MKTTFRAWIACGLVLAACCPLSVLAQDEADQADAQAEEKTYPPGKFPYAEQTQKERTTLDYLLEAEAWHYRCFGLFRLERFEGDEARNAILQSLKDESWQVRCFAIRAAVRKGVEIPAGAFDEEEEPRVIRMAQRVGVEVPMPLLQKMAWKEMRSSVPERLVIGIEIAARSGDEDLLKKARKRLSQLLTNMNVTIMVTVGDRLADLLGVNLPTNNVEAWKNFVRQSSGNLSFPEFKPQNDEVIKQKMAPIAELDADKFTELVNYLDTLYKQDIEVAMVIDGTGSMGRVIQQAQAQTNRLMITLNDLAQSMKMGVVVYRDKGDRPALEAAQLTDDMGKLRSFLFDVEAKGGGDFPEDIYSGLHALGSMRWSRKSIKQAIIIADAPPHLETEKDIKALVKSMADDGLTVHTIMSSGPAQTKLALEQIARWGSGQFMELDASDDLGKMVIRFAVDEKLHPSFDHLYDLYKDMGM